MPVRAAVVTRVARALGNQDAAALSDRELLGRFADRGDQDAFAAVVARHGPMVLGVCRRALPGPHDPEAACQAVFLLLAGKAGRVRWRSSAAGWLYVAARRVARNARVAADRRARREARAAVPEAVPPADPVTGRELVAALDAELDRLPPRYREPLVLCYLEGLPQDEAAARLGLPLETLKSQLKRGRQKLAAALTARGCDLGVVLLAAAAVAEARAVSPAVRRSILAAVSRPSLVLAPAKGALGAMKALTVGLAAAVAVALGVQVGSAPPTAAQPPKGDPAPAVEPVKPLIGGSEGRFRAAQPIDDARYAAGGRRIVGCAGTTLYVWDADGTRLRTIDTGLARLPDPTRHRETTLAFAVHPTKPLVACGGVKDGRTRLQVWDFETGKTVADVASPCDALKVLAWTPDGARLLERANVGWTKPTGWKLIVRDDQLKEVRAHDLPPDFGEWSTVMHPLSDNRQAVLWQSNRDPLVLDLDTGATVRTLDFRASVPSDVCPSPDGRTLALTGTEVIGLLDLTGKGARKDLPVLRGGWQKPRPLFSPDGQTVYVWDHRPIAYDVATGKEKWKATFRTVHTVRVELCDVSRDGKTVLARHGNTLAPLDAATGTERLPAAPPSSPPALVWSPDGKTLFTRAGRHDRTWTAWDAATGSRKFDLLPAGFAPDDNWKMLPDLFFLPNGREAVVGLERSESTERVGPKEFLVFDVGTGKCVRRFGDPLPNTDETKWMHPVGLDPTGTAITMQTYAVSGTAGPGGGPVNFDDTAFVFPTVRWDPVKKARVGSWSVAGHRTEPPRHYHPYCVTIDQAFPDPTVKTTRRAALRCYSAADGRLLHELPTGFASAEPDRVQGDLLLSLGYDSKWVTDGNRMTYVPQAPFAYDLWDLPTRGRVRVFELDAQATVVLGPGGEYLLRALDDRTVAVHEPFALKAAVATFATSGRPVHIEFSPDGGRVAAAFADASVAVWDTTAWRAEVNAALAKAVPADLEPLWADLAKDPPTGLRAARLLGAAGDRGVKVLSAKITRKAAPDAARVRGWIGDLDSPRFAVREKAEQALRALGGSAETDVRAALGAGPSAEVKERLTKILAAIEAREVTPVEVRELRAARAVRWADTAAARALLAEWAKGDPDAPLTKAAAGR